jgi:hypothetical protein
VDIAVGEEEDFVGNLQEGFVVVVRDDDSFLVLVFPDQPLDGFYRYGSEVGEGLVEDAERGVRA